MPDFGLLLRGSSDQGDPDDPNKDPSLPIAKPKPKPIFTSFVLIVVVMLILLILFLAPSLAEMDGIVGKVGRGVLDVTGRGAAGGYIDADPTDEPTRATDPNVTNTPATGGATTGGQGGGSSAQTEEPGQPTVVVLGSCGSLCVDSSTCDQAAGMSCFNGACWNAQTCDPNYQPPVEGGDSGSDSSGNGNGGGGAGGNGSACGTCNPDSTSSSGGRCSSSGAECTP